MSAQFDPEMGLPPERRAPGRVLAAVLAFCTGIGCGPETTIPTTPQPPLIVIAVDGLEWDVLLPLVREGRLPHLERLMEEGVWGQLETFQPTLSPIIWTTIASGKRPAEHGIEGFTLEENGNTRLYRSGDRRTKSFWNIASDFGKRVAVLGWWASWPVEALNGINVTQMSLAGEDVAKGGLLEELPHQVWPEERTAMVQRVRSSVAASEEDLLERIFGADRSTLDPLEVRLFEHCAWSVRADESYARLALELLEEDEPFDLLAVYLGSPDVLGHRFWRYREPERFDRPPNGTAVERCGTWIDDNAVWIDAWIGRLREAAGERANIVVLSDHGMHGTGFDGGFEADAPIAELNSGHHLDAPPGVLIAAGPSVRDGERRVSDVPVLVGTIYDVLPTWLAWLDVPAGRDMRGRVAESWITLDHLRAFPPRRVETHDDPAWLEGRSRRKSDAPSSAEIERLEQLSDLGYVGFDDE